MKVNKEVVEKITITLDMDDAIRLKTLASMNITIPSALCDVNGWSFRDGDCNPPSYNAVASFMTRLSDAFDAAEIKRNEDLFYSERV